MSTEYPYTDHQNLAIHWGNHDVANGIQAPTAVEVGGHLTHFSNESSVRFRAEEKFVIASFLCGRLVSTVEEELEQRGFATRPTPDIIKVTYGKLGVGPDEGDGKRRQEALVARAHFAGVLTADERTLPFPEDWQQPYRDMLCMLAAGCGARELAQRFYFTNASNHLAMASHRVAAEFGLDHVEVPGPTIMALGAGLLSTGDKETLLRRLHAPLTNEERAYFETTPPRGGIPLLPDPRLKYASQPLGQFGPVVLPHTLQELPDSPHRQRPQQLLTVNPSTPGRSTQIIRPEERIWNFKNRTVWFKFEGGPIRRPRAQPLPGVLTALGIQHSELKVANDVYSSNAAARFKPHEVAVLCARAILTPREIEATFGITPRNQHNVVSKLRDKLALRMHDPDTRRRLHSRRSYETMLPVLFEDPQLLRATSPPRFDGLEQEYGLLMEFGPFLAAESPGRGDTIRAIVRKRMDQGYPKEMAHFTAIDDELRSLRESFRVETAGLTFLYLAHMDYQKQQRRQVKKRKPEQN